MANSDRTNPDISAAAAHLSRVRGDHGVPDHVSSMSIESADRKQQKNRVESAAFQLQRLREHRNWPDKAEAVGVGVGVAKRELNRKAKASGSLGGAWEELTPQAFHDRAGPVGVVRGVLTIGVDDSSTRYLVDKWLRGGGQDALAKSSGVPFHKVKLVLAKT